MHDLRVIAANFLGRTRDYPAFGKYDPLQKIYHAILTLLAAGLIFSGAPICSLTARRGRRSPRMDAHHAPGARHLGLRVHRHSRRARVLRRHSGELASARVDVDRSPSRIEIQPVSRCVAVAAAR